MNSLPFVRSGKAWLVFLLVGAALFAFVFTPLVTWSLLGIYLLGICFLLLCAVCAGIVPAYLTTLLCCMCFYAVFGWTGFLCAALYLLPALTAFWILYCRKIPFFKAVGFLTALIALSQLLVFVLLNSLSETALFDAAGNWARSMIADSEYSDTILLMLYRYGFLSLDASFAETMVEGIGEQGFVLSGVAREELLYSVRSLISASLYSLAPSMLVGHSILSATAGAGYALYRGAIHQERLAFKAETSMEKNPSVDKLEMPPLSGWALPRGWGLRVAVLGLGYLLTHVANNTVRILGAMLFSAASTVYLIQGVAYLHFLQKKRGRKKSTCTIVPVVLYLILPIVLRILGLLDQLNDPRALRGPKEEDAENSHDDL